MVFYVFRGESPSEMNIINGAGTAYNVPYEFVDVHPSKLDLHKVYYYQVVAVEYDGVNEVQQFASHEFTWEGDLDLVGLYIVEENYFEHRWLNGVPVFFYKKRMDGEQCPDCWDPVLKRVTESDCETCLGTGKVGGFYPPIPGWLKFEPDPAMAQVMDWGERQPNQTDFVFTNYPLLHTDDVILELKNNKFWKVANLRTTEKNRVTTLQVGRADAIKMSDIEYEIDVPDDERMKLVRLLEERGDIREF